MEVWQINSWHYHIVPHMWYALTTKKIAFLIHMSIFSWIHPLTWNNTSIWGVNYMSFLTTWIFFQYNHSFQLWTNMIKFFFDAPLYSLASVESVHPPFYHTFLEPWFYCFLPSFDCSKTQSSFLFTWKEALIPIIMVRL